MLNKIITRGRSILPLIGNSIAPPITGWDLSKTLYIDSFTSIEPYLDDAIFKQDGLKMYLLEQDSNGGTYYSEFLIYSLSNAFDLSSIVHDTTLIIGTGAEALSNMFLSNDGTKLYFGYYWDRSIGEKLTKIVQYDLTIPFDLTTYTNQIIFDLSTIGGIPIADYYMINLNQDGTKIYISDNTNMYIYQYSMSTSFDLTTISYDNISFLADASGSLNNMQINPSGDTVFILDGTVRQFSLATPFDISSMTLINTFTGVQGLSDGVVNFFVNDLGTEMFIITGNPGGTIYRYTLI